MSRRVCHSLFLLGAFCGAAQAHHFAIDLNAHADSQKVAAHAETVAPGQKARPRPILHLKAGQRVDVKWVLTNTDAKNSFKDVLVHFFVVKEEKVGQQVVPKLDKTVQTESALTMDFRPGDKARGDLSFTIDSPGAYLLRLETVGAAIKPDAHEHYAAIDLIVEETTTDRRPPDKERP